MTTGTIAPCLWFDDEAEEAAAFYARFIPGSRVNTVTRYPTGLEVPGGKPPGSVMSVEFELAGSPFSALNGGPHFTPNPTISFFVHTSSTDETERIARALSGGGSYLMPLDEYAWSECYAWVQDQFGISWQVMLAGQGEATPVVVPSLLFAGDVHGRAEDALNLYAATLPSGRVDVLDRYSADEAPEGTIKYGRVSFGNQALVAMDSHLEHNAVFNEAISLQIYCRNQEEVDYYWDRLTLDGEESQCGWLKDRFGVSWQVVPTRLLEMLTADEAATPAYDRLFEAILTMKKLDIAALEAAYGNPS
jgi:predicted 3-demethylubiquinone-9 3-methyltransferase (glyoxalase superfamily)